MPGNSKDAGLRLGFQPDSVKAGLDAAKGTEDGLGWGQANLTQMTKIPKSAPNIWMFFCGRRYECHLN
jgi:hypothetical protein